MKTLIFIFCFFIQSKLVFAQIDSLENLLSKTTQDTLKILLLNDLAWEYAYTSPQKAQEYAQKSLELSLKTKFSRGQASSYGMLGIIKDIQGESQEALNFYLKELAIEEKLGNKSSIAATLTNIGALHFNQEQYEQALKYFQRSLRIEKETKNDLGALGSLINIGIIHKNLRKYQEAEAFLQEANKLNEQVRDEQQQAYIWANLASVALSEGKREAVVAIDYFNKAIAINEKTENQSALAISYNGLSEAYRLQSNFSTSVAYAQKALIYAQKLKAQKQIQASLLNLAQAYEKMGEYAKAYNYFQEYTEIKEKLINEANYKQIAEAEAKFQNEAQKRIIAEKEISLEKSQRNLWLTLGLLGVFVVVASLLWGLFRSKQKSNTILKTQKQRTEKALKDREILLQEIHHRVKNNLQIVSSLLNLQSRQSQDKDTTEAIRQATNRVKSMALLHQNLYQNENLQLVNAKDYISQLVKSLMSAYKSSVHSVEIEKNIEELHLDIDLMMPLGLILNEWLTNAFKYAFLENQEGKVRVSLFRKEDKLVLEVRDNGIGIDKQAESSFGRNLVEMLAEKLEANIYYKNQNGTKCTLEKVYFEE